MSKPEIIDLDELLKDEVHSALGASGAKRWMNCSLSPQMIAQATKSKSTKYAVEGTVAHYIANEFLNLRHKEYVGVVFKKDGHEIEVTEEMIENIMIYVAYCRDLMNKYQEIGGIEERVNINDELFGTADFALFVLFKILIVVDFKYGAGVKVNALENEQGMFYALGKLLSLPQDEQDSISEIVIAIVQPRGTGNAIEEFVISKKDLLKWKDKFLNAAALTKSSEAKLNPGDWCRFCAAAPTCPALKQQTMEIAKIAFDDVVEKTQPPAPETLTNQELVMVLDKADIIRKWLSNVEDYAEKLAKDGTDFPGYIVVDKFGNRVWTDDKKAGELLEQFLADDAYTKKVLSVAQAEKMLKGHTFWTEELVPLIEKPFKGTSLIKEKKDSKRIKEAFATVK